MLSAGDSDGNMVSWVNSNFDEFGSGITVPGYGFILHNRGALFSLDPKSPNAIAPHKRPYNTLSAGFVMKRRPAADDRDADGRRHAGARTRADRWSNMFDLGANLQAATDMARFRHGQIPNVLRLESPLYSLVGAQLSGDGT